MQLRACFFLSKKVRKMGILNELTELIFKNYFAYLQCMNQSDIWLLIVIADLLSVLIIVA